MSQKNNLLGFGYRHLVRPAAFLFDPQTTHEVFTNLGEKLENHPQLLSPFFQFSSPQLKKTVLGVEFANPVGLAAGFDYNGHLARTMKYTGFGFNTVGTVTAHASPGNAGPQLTRLPQAQAIWVNKGFKSDGAVAVAKRLDQKNLIDHTIGLSVGASNVPAVNTVAKAIDDYLFTFNTFKDKSYVKYFELNISCPNVNLTGIFTKPENFENLLKAIMELKINQPIFIKMPSGIESATSDTLIKTALAHNISGFIFSNLLKTTGQTGGLSGRPVFPRAKRLITHTRQEFGHTVTLIGLGGIFSPIEAKEYLNTGADLIQLITGLIYEGPQLPAQICEYLAGQIN